MGNYVYTFCFQTEVVLDVLSTILTYKNMDGFSSLEDVHVTQEVLLSAEKYNQYIGIAALVNDSRTSDQILYSGDSIGNAILYNVHNVYCWPLSLPIRSSCV